MRGDSELRNFSKKAWGLCRRELAFLKWLRTLFFYLVSSTQVPDASKGKRPEKRADVFVSNLKLSRLSCKSSS